MTPSPPQYVYCPFCSTPLGSIVEGTVPRKACPKCHWIYYPHVAAAATAVILRHEEVLLVKPNREPFKGTWMCPSGFVEFGEHPQETAAREVKEEIGLTALTVEPIVMLQSPDDPRLPGHFVFFYRV